MEVSGGGLKAIGRIMKNIFIGCIAEDVNDDDDDDGGGGNGGGGPFCYQLFRTH